MTHNVEQALGCERLFDEIVSAEPHRLDGNLDIAVPGDHHHRKLRVDLLRASQQFEPVNAFHFQVGNENTGKIHVQLADGRGGVLMRDEFEASKLQPLRYRLTHRGFIIDEQDWTAIRHERPSPAERFA